MIGGKWFDPMVGVDIHWVLVPTPAGPVPTPLPHPFVGLIYDPLGMAIGAAISAGVSLATGAPFAGPVLINGMPASATGTEGTNKMVMPHIPTPPGVSWAPVPAGLKPPIPGKKPNPGVPSPVPTNDATIVTGSKTVYIGGTNATRLGDLAMSCGEPLRLPSSTTLCVPMGPPVLIGGPPALDFWAAGLSAIRTSWVSDRLRSAVNRIFGEGSRAARWINKGICFFTGHPVDVASGMLMTDHVDVELPGPIPFRFERTYYSRSDYVGPLGHGWGHSYDQFLVQADERLVYHDGDGREIYFDLLGIGESCRNASERLDLWRRADGFRLDRADGLQLLFGPVGRPDGALALTQITDWEGHRVALHHDAAGRLVEVLDSAGRRLRFHNDALGRLVALELPGPVDPHASFAAVRFAYDDAGDLVAVTDAADAAFRYAYKHHLLVQETDRNGLSFYFAYDGIDHDAWCVRTWGDGGIHDHALTYDKETGVTIVEDSVGAQRVFFWNEFGAVTRVMDPRGAEASLEWDDRLNLVAETDPRGNTTRHAYDERGNRTETVAPDGARHRMRYNSRGQLVEWEDPLGARWQWEYDDAGRLLQEVDPLGEATRLLYLRGRLLGFVDAQGAHVAVARDDAGNVIGLRTPDGAEARWEYDLLGRNTVAADGLGNVWRRHYDLLGRVRQVEEADGNVRVIDYDAEGNIVSARDHHDHVRLTYTARNKLASREQAGVTIRFQYDTEARLTGIVNERGLVNRFVLGRGGELVEEHGFDGARFRYACDALGQVTEVTGPGDVTTRYTYDAAGRVTAVAYADGTSATYAYDGNGHLVEAANGSATVRFAHDALGRLLREERGEHWVESRYDAGGRRTALRSSLGASVAIGRDAMGDVTELACDDGSGGAAEPWRVLFARDAGGREIERHFPGGVLGRWHHDRLGRPEWHEIAGGAAGHRWHRFLWSVDDRLLEVHDQAGRRTRYAYNALGALLAAQRPDGVIEFRMRDAVGNLFRSRDLDDRRYGDAGQLLAAERTRFEYDAAGNRTKRIDPDGSTWQYRWNAAGLLASVLRPDGRSVTFEYDALGRRIGKRFDGAQSCWLWDGDHPLHEWVVPATTPPAASDAREGAGAGEVVTWLFTPETFAPLAKVRGGRRYGIVTDHVDAPIAMFDEHGRAVWSGDPGPLGEYATIDGEREACPFRFAGQYEDVETGLYYNRWRYYDPATGVYMSQDPLGVLGGLAPYAYANDPFTAMDPFGLSVARRLGRAMGADGRPVLPGQTPHHVVQRNGGKYGNLSQDLLRRNGVPNVDHASNGARLWGVAPTQVVRPGHPGRGAPTYHAGNHLHGDGAQRMIYRILRAAEKKGLNVEAVLRDIVARQEAGTWRDSYKGCQ